MQPPGAGLGTRRWTDRTSSACGAGIRSPTWTTADMKELSVTLLPRSKFHNTHSQLSAVVLDGHCSHRCLEKNFAPNYNWLGLEPPTFRLGAQSEYNSATSEPTPHIYTGSHTHLLLLFCIRSMRTVQAMAFQTRLLARFCLAGLCWQYL